MLLRSLGLLSLVTLPLASSYTITVANNCAEPIWPAAFQSSEGQGTNGGSTGNVFPPLPIEQTGYGPLAHGETWSISPPYNWRGGRVWARTGCTGSDDTLTCQTGTCIGGLHCTDFRAPFASASGSDQDYTKVEFGFCDGSRTDECAFIGENTIFWNLSVVEGYNLPVSVKEESTGNTKTCMDASCPGVYHTDKDDGAMTMTKNGQDNARFTVTFCPAGAAVRRSVHGGEGRGAHRRSFR